MFGDRTSGAYLPKFSWTKIVRHQMVPGRASPDDPDLAQYWNDRRRKNPPPMDRVALRLLKTQGGRCPLCGDTLLYAGREPNSPREWEEWFAAVRKALTRHHLAVCADPDTPEDTRIRLVHSTCHRHTSKGASRRNGNVPPLHRY